MGRKERCLFTCILRCAPTFLQLLRVQQFIYAHLNIQILTGVLNHIRSPRSDSFMARRQFTFASPQLSSSSSCRFGSSSFFTYRRITTIRTKTILVQDGANGEGRDYFGLSVIDASVAPACLPAHRVILLFGVRMVFREFEINTALKRINFLCVLEGSFIGRNKLPYGWINTVILIFRTRSWGTNSESESPL